jgi:hypothetical protein
LEILEHIDLPVMSVETGWAYDFLIRISLDMNSPQIAKEYLEFFSQYINKPFVWPTVHGWYDLSKARVLKSSSRIRDNAEAEKILKQLLESGDFMLITQAILEVCDLYLGELRSSKNLEILIDIQPLISRLLKESERTNSFSLQSRTSLLQGKLSLLQMNMGEARRHLTQAENIAENHGLQLLAREISKEHDKLLEQLKRWENLDKNGSSISDRLELADLDNSLSLIQGKRMIKAPEISEEVAVMLLIIAEGGILLFSYSFTDDWVIDDDLFGGFLSAFTTFSNEIFSEGLDRAKFGQFTVLMESVGSFSICYLFKGQTYIAKKKLSDFTENVQSNASIMETLNRFYKAGQVIELKDFPFLDGFIKRIFLNN